MPLSLSAYVKPDGSYDLVEALHGRSFVPSPGLLAALDFLAELEEITPIRNPEAAAIAFAHACSLANSKT